MAGSAYILDLKKTQNIFAPIKTFQGLFHTFPQEWPSEALTTLSRRTFAWVGFSEVGHCLLFSKSGPSLFSSVFPRSRRLVQPSLHLSSFVRFFGIELVWVLVMSASLRVF